jgi:serine protease AprX
MIAKTVASLGSIKWKEGQMIKKLTASSRVINWGRPLSLLLVLALVLPVLVLAPSGVPRAQPVLLQIATERPDETLPVIVQRWGTDTGAEDLVRRLGGVVTKDLHIIDAFAAELPATAVSRVAAAAGVRWVSLDAPMVGAGAGGGECEECIDTSNLLSAYVQAIGASQLWSEDLQGQDITIAVVDSGISKHPDVKSRLLKSANFTNTGGDHYGHGTHVAGIMGGSGAESGGAYVGVAPKVNLVDIKICNNRGEGSISDVVAGLQWIYENKDTYNIRVVNVSLHSSVPQSYHTSPLDAALEILWFNEVVVVVASGNNGDDGDNGVLYPPANDPFVITVGATDDMGTADIGDDVLAPFSAYGTIRDYRAIEEGKSVRFSYRKPDLVAPGTNIISLLAGNDAELVEQHQDHHVDGFGGAPKYFRMSGTSMSSAVTAGAVALLLQADPDLTPDQVKYRLMATAQRFGRPKRVGAGYLNVYDAVHETTAESANTGTQVSWLLTTGEEPVAWDSINWNSINWNSINWNSINWNSINWNSINWNSVYWGQ